MTRILKAVGLFLMFAWLFFPSRALGQTITLKSGDPNYPCNATGLNNANGALTGGGIIDATGCGSISAGSTTVTVSHPDITLLLPVSFASTASTAISVTADRTHIFGAPRNSTTFTQGTLQMNMIVAGSGVTDLDVAGINFVGVGGSTVEGPTYGSGVELTGVTRANVRNCTFSSWTGNGVLAQNSNDIIASYNVMYSSLSSIVRFVGVVNGDISHNLVRDTSLASSSFNVAMGIDSVSGTGYQNSNNVRITNNTIRNYAGGEAILVHDGTKVTIEGNEVDNVAEGIGVSLFASPDTISDVNIEDNVLTGTSSSGVANSTGQVGIDVGGSSGTPATRVNLKGNTIHNFNAIGQQDNYGCLTMNYTTTAVIEGNILEHCWSYGLQLSTSLRRFIARNNVITDTQSSVGTQKYGIWVPSTTANTIIGRVEGNYIDNVAIGFRADSQQTGVLLGEDEYTNISNLKIYGQSNITTCVGVLTCP